MIDRKELKKAVVILLYGYIENSTGKGRVILIPVPVENGSRLSLSPFKLHLESIGLRQDTAPRLPPSAIRPEQGTRADGNPGLCVSCRWLAADAMMGGGKDGDEMF